MYRKLLRQAKRFSDKIASGEKCASDILKQAALEGLKREIDRHEKDLSYETP